jgi:hypothetical protein
MKRAPRIFYAAGPGDVIGTYRCWLEGRDDPSEVSATFSGQFLSVCKEIGAEAFIAVQRSGDRTIHRPGITIEERATPYQKSRSAVLFHAGQVLSGLRLLWKAVKFRADVAVVIEGTHWFMLAAFARVASVLCRIFSAHFGR